MSEDCHAADGYSMGFEGFAPSPRVRKIMDDLAAAQARIAALEKEVAFEKTCAKGYAEHAQQLRCQKCHHPHGIIYAPKGLEEDGYVPVFVCPCDCHADVPALKARIVALEAEPAAWPAPIPCAERLPKSHKWVLGYRPVKQWGVWEEGCFDAEQLEWHQRWGHAFHQDAVTHWLPLPEPARRQDAGQPGGEA